MLDSQFIVLPHLRMHYLQASNNGPTLLLLHGLTANAHAFDALVREGLTALGSIISVDLRGRGQTDTPKLGYTMKEHAEDVIALLDALAISEVIVVGHSFGGFLGLYLARFYPNRITKLVMLDAAANMHPQTKEMLAPALARLGQTYSSFDDYLSLVKRAPYLTFWDPEMESYYRADVSKNPDGSVTVIPKFDQMMEAVVRGSLGEPWLDYLAEVNHPTMLINAPGAYTMNAPLLPENYAMDTVERMKQATYAKVSGNHQTMLYGEGAKEIVQIIQYFIKS